MQNLLGGLIQVQLFILQIHYRDSIRGGPCKEEKEELKLQMKLKLKLKPLEISLELDDSFRLQLLIFFMYPLCVET